MNADFWTAPPWQGGVAKHRLGLKPITIDAWLSPGNEASTAHKSLMLDEHYGEVVALSAGGYTAQAELLNLTLPSQPASVYPDTIANVAMTVADDLCLLDVLDKQRLIAACVCSPSYWAIQEKIDLPLLDVHAPVQNLNASLGQRIAHFITNVPVGQPFVRHNWFVHGDAALFHPVAEGQLRSPVEDWVLRSERQTLCRLSEQILLFTIKIVCEPLRDIWHFPQAYLDLRTTLANMSVHEICHFGGAAKHAALHEYIAGRSDEEPN